MRTLILLALVVLQSACMSVSDMANESVWQLSDAGLLDHSETRRQGNWRLQSDSFLYIAQGPFAPMGDAKPPANVVANQAFKGFIDYFPNVQKARGPLGLEQALQQAQEFGAHYLLYARFAYADDRIGTVEEWEDQEAVDRLGTDSTIIQLTLLEINTRFLVDSTTIRSRGGLFSLYDSKPQDLLGPPLREYAQRLQGIAR